jgi:hypothetical protein
MHMQADRFGGGGGLRAEGEKNKTNKMTEKEKAWTSFEYIFLRRRGGQRGRDGARVALKQKKFRYRIFA